MVSQLRERVQVLAKLPILHKIALDTQSMLACKSQSVIWPSILYSTLALKPLQCLEEPKLPHTRIRQKRPYKGLGLTPQTVPPLQCSTVPAITHSLTKVAPESCRSIEC